MELVQRLLDECNRLDVKMGLRLLHKYRSEKTIQSSHKHPLTEEHKKFNQQALDQLVQDVEKLEQLRAMMREVRLGCTPMPDALTHLVCQLRFPGG